MDSEVAEIRLSNGMVALVDGEDADALRGYKWAASKRRHRCYAVRSWVENGKDRSVTMHRQIMQPPTGLQVDHINGDGLDNRRCNLRLSTASQNQMNRDFSRGISRFKGVWHKAGRRSRPWAAYIAKDGKRYFLGAFSTEEEAAMAYDDAARRLFGEFARTNLPLLLDALRALDGKDPS